MVDDADEEFSIAKISPEKYKVLNTGKKTGLGGKLGPYLPHDFEAASFSNYQPSHAIVIIASNPVHCHDT